MRGFGMLMAGVTITSLAFTGTAVADTSDYANDIAVSAVFDQPAYNSDDHLGMDVTITNNGTDEQIVSGIDGFDTGVMLDQDSYDTLTQERTLASGDATTLHLTGTIHLTTEDHRVVFSVFVISQQGDDNPGDNRATISAPVTQLYGFVDGHVYTDSNHNGSYDAGEGLGQITVRLQDYDTLAGPMTTTAADGSYRFDAVPTGKYYVSFESADGWIFPHDGATEVTHLGLTRDAAAVRPLTDTLHASGTFDKQRYQAGDTAHVTIKIRNTGTTAVNGVRNLVGGAGSDADLESVDCGALNPDAGVNVPAGHTVTATCTGTVPANADTLGLVSFYAGLGVDDGEGGPAVSLAARVGNHKGYADAKLLYDQDGNGNGDDDEGVPGVKVALVNPNTGVVVARATSDANGDYSVTNIPTGQYRVRVLGPWQPANGKLLLGITTRGACGAYCGRWYELIKPKP